MRNKFFKVMAIFAVAFATTGALASTSPPPNPTSQDTVVSSTVVPDITIESAPLSNPAFMLPLALIKPKEAKKTKSKLTRARLRPNSQLSWAEWWSMPQDLHRYNFTWASAETRASHFASKLKTAGKSHVRRQMRRAAFKANRTHCKKRRSIRATRGEVKTSKGWISRKAFWTSPLNRALRSEAQKGGLKITKCVQALIDFKRSLEILETTTRTKKVVEYRVKPLQYPSDFPHAGGINGWRLNRHGKWTKTTFVKVTEEKAVPAVGSLKRLKAHAHSMGREWGLSTACFTSKYYKDVFADLAKTIKELPKTELPEVGSTDAPQPVSVETRIEKTGNNLAKIAKVAAAVVVGGLLSLFTDMETASFASAVATLSFKEYWSLTFNDDDTDYSALREQAEKCLPKDLPTPSLNAKQNGQVAAHRKAIEAENTSDEDYCHAAYQLIELLEIHTAIPISGAEGLEEKFDALVNSSNPSKDCQIETFLNFIEDIPENDEESLRLISNYILTLEKQFSYGNPAWKTTKAMLSREAHVSLKDHLKTLFRKVLSVGFRPEEAGNRFIKVATDEKGKLHSAIDSSMSADYVLTIKSYPSADRTLKGDGKGHGKIPKLAITADIAWMSGYNALVKQYAAWVSETGMESCPLEVKFGDVIFVQNLKDSRGNETEIKTLNEVIMALGDGYDAVTPGFWVKRNHKFGDWVRDIFGTNKEVRARARSMATTPSQQGLDTDKDGNTTLIVAADLTRNGQPGADGANLLSRNYRMRWNGWIGQLRLHTNFHDIVTKGMQCKGLLRRHQVWVVRTGDDLIMDLRFDRDDRISAIKENGDLSPEDKTAAIDSIIKAYLPCIVMDIQNIKGRSSKEIAGECEKLNAGQALCLNTYSLEGNNVVPSETELTWEQKLTLGRLFGGILAEDYAGKSSTSWQQNQLFSPSILDGLVTAEDGAFRQDVARQFEKLYGKTSTVIGKLFDSLPEAERTKAQAAAMAQRGMSQRTVESFVFGMRQKWWTHYCDQIAMPEGWFITNNKTHQEGSCKYLAATGQPQLYHQCILMNRVMDHADIHSIIKSLKKDSAATLTISQMLFLKDFDKLLQAEGCTESYADEILSRLQFVAGSFGRKGEDTLVWISKIDQDKMQRDSDGDRVLFSHRSRDVSLAKLHNKAIGSLPVPRIEVGNVGQDGDEAHLRMVEGLWADPSASHPERLKANTFICAPNQGQGPTGQLVNMASALLNYILWQDENGNWAPHSSVRETALQLYAFVCLLIQNSIDRPKKPHAVPTLGQAFEVDLYSGTPSSYEVEGGEGNPSIGTERWPAMVWENGFELSTRVPNNFNEQYNTPVLKHWLSWCVNMVNHVDSNVLFDKQRPWIDIVNKCAEIMHSNTIKVLKDESEEKHTARIESIWKQITVALGREEKDFEDVRDSWAWSDELYRFKKEASLEMPLQKAAPGLMVVSDMVTEEDRKAKAKYSLKGNTMRQLFLSLSAVRVNEVSADPQCYWANNPWGGDASINYFVSLFHSEVKRNRAGERLEKGTSELMANQKVSDTAEYLKEMKDAMNTGDFTFPAAKVLDRAFNSKVKHRSAAVSTAICMLAYAAYIGYDQWAANNDVLMCWSKEAYEGRYEKILWGVDTEEDGSLADENTPKGQLIRLLAENETYSPEVKAEILDFLKSVWKGEALESDCPWPFLYTAAIESKNSNKDGTAYGAIWSQWIPALEEHLELAADADATRKYFMDGPNAQEAIQYLLDGTAGKISPEVTDKRSYMQQCIFPGFDIEIKAIANKMVSHDLSSHPGAEKYRDWVMEKADDGTLKNMSMDSALMALYGVARKLQIAGDYRSILNMAKPIIQARRLRSWVDSAFKHLKMEERNEMVRSAMINETVIQKSDPDAPSGVVLKTYRTLKGRPEITVPVDNQVKFFQGILDKGLSFYALAPTGALWMNFNNEERLVAGNEIGRKLTSRWVHYDSRMRGSSASYSVVTLAEEFNAEFAIGDIFSCAELETWKHILTSDLDSIEPNGENAGLIPRIERMLGVIQGKLQDKNMFYAVYSARPEFLESLSHMDYMKAKFLYDKVAVPLHWGGNNKSAIATNSRYAVTTRTSAHRPIWRTIFAIMGDGEFTAEKGEAYNYLAGTKIIWGAKSGAKKGLDENEAKSGSFLKKRTFRSNFYEKNKSQFKGLRPFLPFTSPGVARKNHNGQDTWLKVPRSPMNEYFGSIVIEGSNGIETAYLDYDKEGIMLSENSPDLERIIILARAKGVNAPEAMRRFSLQQYQDHSILRVNGILAPWAVARQALKPEFDTILPRATAAQKAELILGCRHITAAWDSYVLLKWDTRTQARMMGKGTTSFKNFMKIIGGSSANFTVQLPENTPTLLVGDLFSDPEDIT